MPERSRDEIDKIKEKYTNNVLRISPLKVSLAIAYTQGTAKIPAWRKAVGKNLKEQSDCLLQAHTFQTAAMNALREVQENYRKINELNETIRSFNAVSEEAVKQTQENLKKIGTLTEAAEKAQKQVQENIKNVGTLQAAAAIAYKKVLENAKNIGYSPSAVYAHSYKHVKKPVPEQSSIAGSFYEDIKIAELDYQASSGGLDCNDFESWKDFEKLQIDYEEKVNEIVDEYSDDLDDIEEFATESVNLLKSTIDSIPTESEIEADCEGIKNDCQIKINQYYDDERNTIEKRLDNESDLSISELIKNLDTIKSEYETRINQILEEYKNCFNDVRTQGYDFSNPETLKELDDISNEYQDKIDQILDDYKDQLDKVGNLQYGKPVSTQAELLDLPVIDLLARTIFGEQSLDLDGQNAVAWNIINNAKGNIQSALTASRYRCLVGEGGNRNSYTPDTNSKSWKHALELAKKIMDGEEGTIPNDIGDTTQFRTASDFDSKSSTKTDSNGNIVTYYKQRGEDNIIRDYKVKNIVRKGGQVFFSFDYSP